MFLTQANECLNDNHFGSFALARSMHLEPNNGDDKQLAAKPEREWRGLLTSRTAGAPESSCVVVF